MRYKEELDAHPEKEFLIFFNAHIGVILVSLSTRKPGIPRQAGEISAIFSASRINQSTEVFRINGGYEPNMPDLANEN